jgi:N-acetylmuramoyl-L-alanine amidase
LVILAAFLVLVPAGCAKNKQLQADNGVLLTPPDTISMYSLADRLGMIISDRSDTLVALRDDRNSVVIFAGPDGRAFVNGKAIAAPTGGVVRADGMLFIPISYEPAIREQMLAPRVRPAAALRPAAPPIAPSAVLRGGLVLIDAGHGGQDPGALGARGLVEKTVVLDVARTVTERLAASGVDARMTREGDRFLELDERNAITNRLRPKLFVSIHADSARNRSADGFTVYVSRLASGASIVAADAIARRLQETGVPFRGRKEANYRVLVGSSSPAVLVEVGYLSNSREAAELADPVHRQQLGEAIAQGIVDYLQKE